MDLIGAVHYSNALIQDEYISYYFHDEEGWLYSILMHSIVSGNITRLLGSWGNDKNVHLHGNKEQDFVSKNISERKALFEKIGFGKTEFLARTRFQVVRLPEEGDFRIGIPVTKKAFLEFYTAGQLGKPPQYLYDVISFVVEQNKKPFNAVFIKSERRIGYTESHALGSKMERGSKNLYWIVSYAINAKYNDEQKLENIKLSIQCSSKARYDLMTGGLLSYPPPLILCFMQEKCLRSALSIRRGCRAIYCIKACFHQNAPHKHLKNRKPLPRFVGEMRKGPLMRSIRGSGEAHYFIQCLLEQTYFLVENFSS